MKNDLISREAAIDEVRDIWCRDCYCATTKRDCATCNIEDLIDGIKDLSAVDAAPVVHGRWINKGYITTAYGSIDTGDCSACGAVDVPIEPYDDYCPNCGAKMDGEGCV